MEKILVEQHTDPKVDLSVTDYNELLWLSKANEKQIVLHRILNTAEAYQHARGRIRVIKLQ